MGVCARVSVCVLMKILLTIIASARALLLEAVEAVAMTRRALFFATDNALKSVRSRGDNQTKSQRYTRTHDHKHRRTRRCGLVPSMRMVGHNYTYISSRTASATAAAEENKYNTQARKQKSVFEVSTF